jgi:acyl-CoA synthetase (AMP-forming)/AMP-acid ligase II
MPATIARNLSKRFEQARLVNCYGMSEATSITHYLPAHLSEGRWDSIGIPVPGTSDRIGETDELEVNTPTAMIGYWGNQSEDKSSESMEWIRTGDCAYRDESGLLRITGRVDDIINRGGEKISPLQVESAITQLSGILDVVVIGVDDPDLGQTPAALIVTDNDDFDALDIRVALSEHLADFKIPAHIYRVQELPRNANGKLIRKRVRQIIAEQMQPGSESMSGTGT